MEFLLGNIFGFTQIIIGYPFDTLKTNLQNSKPISQYLHSPFKLYSGIKYPLILNCFSGSVLFGNYDYFYTQTNNRVIAGIITGAIGSVALTPFDYFKIHSQSKPDFKISFANMKKSYAGFCYCFNREIISIPIYFTTFHTLDEQYNLGNIHWYNYNSFVTGGISGVNSWLFTYPIDTLKTRKQLYPDKSFFELVNLTSKMGIFNGLLITLIRAFIVNGSSFMIYSKLKNI